MKKISKVVSALALAVALCLGATVPAFAAEGFATFKDYDEVFVFADGSEYTETDLFGGLKGVMPGDALRQDVEVKNDHSNAVNIYLRAVVHDEEANPPTIVSSDDGETLASMQDFLSQLTMSIYWDGSVIYEASPNEAGALAQNILLGEFAPGESRNLTVELMVPIELGKEYMNRVGEVDWVFVVEELDPEPADSKPGSSTTQTGDNMPIALLAGVCLAAGVAVMVSLVVLKRRRQ